VNVVGGTGGIDVLLAGVDPCGVELFHGTNLAATQSIGHAYSKRHGGMT
jgi:hypothetical protein